MSVKRSSPSEFSVVVRHRLLANERWAAKGIGDVQVDDPRTLGSIRMLSQYGPEGVRLIVAACADVLSVIPVGIVDIFIRAAFRQSTAGVVSVILFAVVLGGLALGLVRMTQARSAAKRYRKQSVFKE